jgi:hypothetical protein
MGPFATHRFLTRTALSAAHVFAWLFIFQYFFVFSASLRDSLVATAVSYALTQVVSILVTPFTARRLRHGIRGMMVNALICLSAAYAVLALSFSGLLGSVPFGILCFAVFMGLYRSLYWIPYELASRKHPTQPWIDIVLAFVPALSGYAMTLFASAPLVVLAASSLIALAAIVPAYSFKNTQEGFSWKYRETFRHLFTRAHRRPLVQAICNGFEGAALLLVWPIAILVLLSWSYAMLGLVLTATYLCTLVVRAFLAPAARHTEQPLVRSVLTVSGWILRGTIAAPVSIVLVDTYYQSASGIAQRGVDTMTWEQSADSNSYIDEFTALKDIGQGIGRVLFCVVLFFLAPLFSFATLALVLFGLTAIVAVFSILIPRRSVKHAF